ncbi:MAG: GatB/YqeY domain-containing protein [Candidatus Colwellbacteria bacterium]|nr:GatB/YqeY domain-containing protein [Candidatus Colwellbacteria bacterium]
MAVFEDIKKNLVEALKSKDAAKVLTLRMLLAAIHNEQIAKGKANELKEEDVLGVLRREAKKRREAAEIYAQAGRGELADKENQELEIIKSYLPAELSDTDVEIIVKEVLAGGETNFGKAMGQVMAKVAGRAEPNKVGEVIKKALGEGSGS